MKSVLAIETSCDDTSVALVREDHFVECCLVASQDLAHSPYGGVVPEIASRNHSLHLLPLIDEALKRTQKSWDDILGVAVTNRPGLIGSLIVGLVTAKTLALAKNKPLIGVHHIEGHILAPFLKDETYQGPDFYDQNFLALVVSGGHTQLYQVNGYGHYINCGETIDDAAGEAFDKFAKMLKLPYPGGVHIDRLALQGNSKAYDFPRPLLKEKDFSFSGLKSSAQRLLQTLTAEEIEKEKANLCASYQKSIVDVLIAKLERAIDQTGIRNFIVSGGVSANSQLRLEADKLAQKKKCQIALPPLRYCTDNAAMIGLVGLLRLQKGETSHQDIAPIARVSL